MAGPQLQAACAGLGNHLKTCTQPRPSQLVSGSPDESRCVDK